MLYKILNKVILLVEKYLSYIVPKDDKLWIYVPYHFKSVAGNIQAVFDYVNINDSNIKQYILDNNSRGRYFGGKSEVYKEFIVKRHSLKGIMLVLRAKVIYVDSGNSFNSGIFNVVQLWHGTGYKNIVAKSKRFTGSKRDFKNILLLVASSIADQKRKKESFLTSNVFVTGSPRNDIFFDSSINKKHIKTRLGIESFNKIICYAPTFRQEIDFKPFSNFFLETLQKRAEENNFVFLIKKHPAEKQLQINKKYKNIIDITEKTNNIQELLLITDVLISDYSGISSDFVLLNRPIIFYIYDFEEYLEKSRDFYYDLKETLPGPFANNKLELLDLIKDMSWFEDSEYQKRFKDYQTMFHQYIDGNSSQRVYYKIQELTDNKSL